MCAAVLATLHTDEQLNFCEELPKIELHAHLNGSIRDSTIRCSASSRTAGISTYNSNVQGQDSKLIRRELAEIQSIDPDLVRLTSKGQRTLAECFKLFDVIHKVTTNLKTVTRIAQEVVQDFAEDNVVYLELRTTPKNRPEHGINKQSYTEAVLAGIKGYEEEASGSADGKQILVKLLLSIDRREGLEAALETVQLAIDLHSQGVVGIDLSGNPSVGSWATWEPALQKARDYGLKLTIHAGEVDNPEETAAILAFRPDRLGHMCFMDEASERELRASRIPLELCLSSNVITESVQGYPDHHFLPLFKAGHPVILCTDDSGVFSTSLSREYAIAASAFQLTPAALLTLAEAAIEHCFLEAPEKELLRSRFEGYRVSHPDVGTQKLQNVPLEPVLDSLQAAAAGCAAIGVDIS